MATPITVPTSDGNVIDTAGGGPIRLLGWSVRIDANAATVDLKAGGSSGAIVATINLAASGGETVYLGSEGIIVNSDVLYADLTGTTTGLKGSILIA